MRTFKRKKMFTGFILGFVMCVGLTVPVMADNFYWIIEAQFEQARSFFDGLAAVMVGGLWGFIDTAGNIVIEPQFYNAFRFFEGLAAIAFERSSWGFIDATGNIVIEPQFHLALRFSEGLASVSIGGPLNWGFIDTSGNMVIEPQYRNARPFSEGLSSVAVGNLNNWGFIDTAGNMVIEPQFIDAGTFSGGLADVNLGGGFIDTNGNRVPELSFRDARPFSEGLAAVAIDSLDNWGFVDTIGNIIIEPQFYTAHSFSEGMAAVEVADGWGFISLSAPPATTTPPPAPEPTATRTLRFAIDDTTFTDNGANRTLEAAPFIQNDRTMVPLRVIGEALGATDLAHNQGVITFNIDGQAFTMTVGEQLPNNMGAPIIIAGRTFVPLAFIINEMGAVARWDRTARAAYIYIN